VKGLMILVFASRHRPNRPVGGKTDLRASCREWDGRSHCGSVL